MKHYCVISHTHWDREWYKTQEEFRLRLIDLIDNLLNILDAESDYVFHMDAQTIVFEDYWEVKPYMKEKCCKYIREGRILVGPWYVQNDFFLTSGEATVRNLLLGMKQANEMGRCAKTGYTPDQFGLISQLPQIFQGFDIDHCVLGRGYSDVCVNENEEIEIKQKPSEFLWKSPDGSEVLGICMSFWYNNAQRFSADIDRAVGLVKNVEKSFQGVATTPYLLLMNGVDHLEPQSDLFPILNKIEERLPEDEKIYQTSLEHYVELVKGAKTKGELPIETGELMQGADGNLLKDTASSRAYIKIKNSELQNMLEHRLEPLYTLLELSGMQGIYPADQLDYLWKMLIRNHAHDSICGCSTDAVHRHMEDRFEEIMEMGSELQRRGMNQLAAHVSAGFDEDDYHIIVFNGLEYSRTETVDVEVDIIADDNPSGIQIVDQRGDEVSFVILEQSTLSKSVFSPVNLPGQIDTVRYKVRMLVKDVPAFGYVVYQVKHKQKTVIQTIGRNVAYIGGADYYLENDTLKAMITSTGKLNLSLKTNGCNYEDILTVQDVADTGNAYIFQALKDDVPVDIEELTPEIVLVESDALAGKICLHYDMTIPAYYDVEKEKRSDETVTIPLDILIGLKKKAESLDIRFEVENRAKDHRMSAFIRTGLQSESVTVTVPYDMISRNKWDIDTCVCNETEHTSGMVAISDGEEGIAVLNRGIYGYEHLQREQGTLTFPIVRATGTISGGVNSDDEAWKIPENQCLRAMCCEISILPQQGDNLDTRAAFAAKAFQNPLVVQCEPVNVRKFSGGRTTVQDTSIAELFYQDMPYADIQLECRREGFFLEGDGLQVTALKKSYDRTGYILRFYNPKTEPVDAVLHLGKLKVGRIWKTNLKETARDEMTIRNHTVSLNVKGKEIVTLFMGGTV